MWVEFIKQQLQSSCHCSRHELFDFSSCRRGRGCSTRSPATSSCSEGMLIFSTAAAAVCGAKDAKKLEHRPPQAAALSPRRWVAQPRGAAAVHGRSIHVQHDLFSNRPEKFRCPFLATPPPRIIAGITLRLLGPSGESRRQCHWSYCFHSGSRASWWASGIRLVYRKCGWPSGHCSSAGKTACRQVAGHASTATQQSGWRGGGVCPNNGCVVVNLKVDERGLAGD
jgi:hypothetical protein